MNFTTFSTLGSTIGKTVGLSVVASLLMTACSSTETKAPFTGTLKTDAVNDMMYNYAPDHDFMNMTTIPVVPDSTGHFTFPDSLVLDDGIRIQLLADNDYFGIYLEKGKSVEGTITQDANGKLIMTFEGDNADINTYYNALCQAFDSMKYFSPDPGEGPSLDEYFALLEKEHDNVVSLLPTIKDAETRKFYEKMTDRMYTWTKIRLIMDRDYESNTDVREDPEFVSLVETIDPNDDLSLECALIFPWLTMQSKSDQNDQLANNIEQLHIVDKQITNANTRKVMMNQLAFNYFSYGQPTQEQAETYMKEYEKIASAYPDLVERYKSRQSSIKEIKAGDALPSDPMLKTPDGKTLRLSDLKGKVTYIDFWATWCGPCCKQIPFMEKLVEKMKGNKDVAFVSISSDTDEAAWKKKLAKDNPEWAQYIFDGADGDTFFSKMNITGIPRFIILNADGTIAVPDALRPSDDGVEAQILGCIY